MSLTQMRLRPQIYKVNRRYYILCGNQLQLKGKTLGHLLVAQDISRDQMLFLAVIRSLGYALYRPEILAQVTIQSAAQY